MNMYGSGYFGGFGGIRVIEDMKMAEQHRRPRSKGKRIQAKWRKDPRNFRPSRQIVHDRHRNVLYCHPAMAQEICRTINTRSC